jgi:hypothetical protein
MAVHAGFSLITNVHKTPTPVTEPGVTGMVQKIRLYSVQRISGYWIR